jgi:hypothetical protein
MTPEDFNRIAALAVAAAAQSTTVWVVTREWTENGNRWTRSPGEGETHHYELVGVYHSEELAGQAAENNIGEYRITEAQVQ